MKYCSLIPILHFQRFFQNFIAKSCVFIICISLLLFFSYNPEDFIKKNPELARIVEQIETGFFTPDQPDLLHDVAMALRKWDR